MPNAPSISLADLPCFDHCVHPDRSLRDVFDLLEENKSLPGVMVRQPGRPLIVLSRSKLLESVQRRYSQELYWDKPVSLLASRWTAATTVLEASTPVSAAVTVALGRTEDALAEPIVARDARGRHTMIDMHALLTAQCRELAEINSQLEAAHREAERASHAKTEFLANMSHEIRTPMTAILGYAELMQDPGADEQQRTGAARTIRRSGEHLLALLNDILDVSKIEAGRFELEPIDHDPATSIAEVVELMRARAVEKNIDLSLEVDPEMPRLVHTDPTRFRQIVANLVGNAVKFTSEGGVRVSLWVDRQGVSRPMLCIAVEDTGIGIDTSGVERLFQTFGQADASMSRRFGGSGLGLSISRKLARLLGGDVTVSSTPGVGSRFVATVDAGLDRVSGRVLLAPVVKAAAEAPLNCTVLLVEDGVDNQRLFAHHLTRAGAKVLLAGDGRQGVELALAHQSEIALVLMDMQMPVVDGYGATAQLRRNGYTGPIVALTAHAMAADKDRAMAAGCNDYLTKPIGRDPLLAAVRRWTAERARVAA